MNHASSIQGALLLDYLMNYPLDLMNCMNCFLIDSF